MEEARTTPLQKDWNEKEMILQECIRSRPLLRQIAVRFLESPDDVETAVNRAIVAATRRPRPFASQGELRGWILRAVIDESLRRLQELQKAERIACPRPRSGLAELQFATWLAGVCD